MVTKSDYSKDEVDLCLSVLVEIMTILHSFKNDIVVIGGCDLVFDETVECSLEKEMPDGAKNSVKFKVPNIVPFIITKGMALWDRYKEKDAYDIWFILKNYSSGIEKLAEEFRPHLKNKLVHEGLEKIRAKFINIDSPGPVWTAIFLEIDDEEESDIVKRDAFERINHFLDILNIKQYQES